MGSETRTSTRTTPTPSQTTTRSKGVNKAKLIPIAVSPTYTNFDFPPRAKHCVIKNSGSQPIRLNFDSDPDGQYWVLKVGDEPIKFGVNGETTLNMKAMGGASEVQLILYG